MPPDEQAARQEIIDVFTQWGAVGTVSEVAKNLGLIDDPRGVVEAATQAVRNYPYQVSHDAYRVSTVGFVNANEAIVVYDVVLDGSPLFAERAGHAVRVEGTWKITRQTVCNDLAPAGAKCAS